MRRIDDERRRGLARAFLGFLPREDRARHPTTWALCRAVADDDDLLDLAGLVPPPQLAANVFLASVHHLLLGGADHALAHCYRSVCERRGLVFEPGDDAAVARELHSFCTEFRAEIALRCTSRATQTNEVGRCAVLAATLGVLAARGDAAVGLLDAGCSAGLNLFVDAYRYDFSGHTLGPADAAVRLACELRGAVPPLGLPTITARVGLDLSPIGAADAVEVAWLLACLWPDDLDRFGRLERALDVASTRADELVLVAGDMVDALPAAAACAPTDDRLVVMDCWSAAYLKVDRRRTLHDAVATLAAVRPVTWITMEHPVVARDLGVLAAEDVGGHDGTVVCLTEFDDGVAQSVAVADTHPHGLWLDWLAPSAPGARFA